MSLQANLGLIDLVLLMALSIALYFDLKEGRIPNKITVTAAIMGLIYRFMTGGVPGIQGGLLGALIGFLILFIPFLFGGIGGGDVKLLTAIGAIKGAQFVLYTAAAMAIIGGIIGVYYYFFLRQRGVFFPYGVAIVIGAVFALSFL